MRLIDIDIEDYLDTVDTKHLVNELKRRSIKSDMYQDEAEDYEKLPLIGKIKFLLGLRVWATKEDIIKEINEL